MGYLVLERRPSEGFYLGEAYIKVLPGSTKSRIRLGIDAPREIKITREELVENAPGDCHPTIPGPWPKAA